MSLYLKYRPNDFENLVWQDFIKNTLKTSILNNRIVWAYLLCWPRGTWKTSTARIFAKTINCLDSKDWNPCLKCDVCKSFSNDTLIDIIEIDAASQSWVDNIRELILKAQFNPTKTQYKVYIIDEVHMLSKWAFNALLKILEEPPTHVKFILATTETHKVPETIISRCQRYDFKKISNVDIKNRLEFIADKEKLKIDEKSIEYIIKNAWWGLRNAISLFEQYIIDWEIKYSSIIKNIWLVSNELLLKFYDLLLNWDNSIVLEFEKLIDDWINIKLFFKELIFTIKDDWIEKIKSNQDISKIIYILEELDNIFIKSKNSLDENTTFLIWLLKIINNFTSPQPSPQGEGARPKVQNKKEKFEDKSFVHLNEKKSIENVSNDDINDIFWGISSKEKKIEQKKEYMNSNFDLNSYITEIKKLWAKWWLTMWIRWASVNLEENNLEIKFKTKFALKTINNTENLTILKQAFDNLGFENWEVILL